MKIATVIAALEQAFPDTYQEEYDNCGLQVGSPENECTGALLTVDICEAVLQEAVDAGCNLVVAHHPLLFKPLKRVGQDSYIERCVHKAILKGISIYAFHTSADNALPGINTILAEQLDLKDLQPLKPLNNSLLKLVTYLPEDKKSEIEQALWQAGAGKIGSYDCCSYTSDGLGCFRPGSMSRPYCGSIGKLHRTPEVKLEVIIPRHLQHHILSALRKAHPYEEPAYDLVSLENRWESQGGGLLGELPHPMPESDFLALVKSSLGSGVLRHSALNGKSLRRVAVCGGAGASMWRTARARGADVFLVGEARYNDFLDVENHLLLVEAGHFETESLAPELFRRIISQEIPNFACRIRVCMSNPVKYY